MILMLMILNSFFIYLDLIIMVLISVAFLTLLERKVLGYIQIRKGPNKVGMMGLLQPFSDAIKLFSKESIVVLKSNYLFYLISPLFSMIFMLSLWMNMPLLGIISNNEYGLMMIFCIMSLGVYPIMVGGWSSNSIYSLIGGMRSIAQTISYEVSMILIILSVVFCVESFNMYMFLDYQMFTWFILMNLPIGMILMVSFLAELNRTPFDFAEGESELVSGFNTEYMSGSFALIFISEYGMIMFMMLLFSIFFMGGMFNLFSFYIFLLMLFMVIWIRGTYPRFRYNNLMYLTWKTYLPVILNYLIFLISIKINMM